MKKKDVGVFKMDNGNWAYRFKIIVDGKEISRRKSTDEKGNKLSNKTEAIKAREAAIVNARTDSKRKQKVVRKTYAEVYKEYCEKGRSDRAYETKRKQDSLWNIHLKERFGKRYVDEISVGEINVLESGDNRHSESGEKSQSESSNKNQSPGLCLLN